MDERKAFEAHLKTMPDWAPEFESHRAWVEQFAFLAWQAATAAERARCAALSPNGLNVIASDSPATVWQKYSAAIRKG